MVVRSYVDQGRTVRDTGIERGDMLVHSEDEWRERARAHVREGRPRHIRNLALVDAIVLVFVLVILSKTDDPDGALLAILAMCGFAIVTVLATMLAWRHIERAIVDGPVPGLYELGLQQSITGFIPYSEIESTQRRTFEREGKTLCLMYPKHDRKEGNRKPHREPWVIDVDFLGEDGVEELEARVHAQGSPE